MSSLIPRRSGPVIRPDQILNAQIAEAERPGIIAAARIHSGAFATSTAIHHAVVLSRAADAAFKASPMSEDLYRSLLMAYGNFASNEIIRLSLHAGGQS
jgi:hypothetical protein